MSVNALVSAKTAATYSSGTAASLASLGRELLRDQKVAWPACGNGFAALRSAEIRSLRVGSTDVRLQWNPQRIVSTAAKVDAASIAARRCFLCVPHLPAEQKGILYREEYLVLCNPSPIFEPHFTISHIDHRPQDVLSALDAMIALASDFAGECVVFYNGPKCGASAPDHLHFQAVPFGAIPFEMSARASDEWEPVRGTHAGVDYRIATGSHRTHCLMRAGDAATLQEAFAAFIGGWKRVAGTQDEPMMNVLAFRDEKGFALIVFLRQKHRPDAFFREGADRLLVSPAAVDIGGHIVTPIEKDFRSLTADMVTSIFEEVSAPSSILSGIFGA